MRPRLTVPPEEVEISAIRAQGAGGQNVNKVANAAHLRFDIATSSLPETVRDRLLKLRDQRISKDGVVVIRAQEFSSLEKNRAEALRRLHADCQRRRGAEETPADQSDQGCCRKAPGKQGATRHRQVRAGEGRRIGGAVVPVSPSPYGREGQASAYFVEKLACLLGGGR